MIAREWYTRGNLAQHYKVGLRQMLDIFRKIAFEHDLPGCGPHYGLMPHRLLPEVERKLAERGLLDDEFTLCAEKT